MRTESRHPYARGCCERLRRPLAWSADHSARSAEVQGWADKGWWDGRPQLRARLADFDGWYDLPVVAHQLRQHHRKGGTAEVVRKIGQGPWYIRIGLARPFNGGKECFVMVNGVYPL